MDPSGGSTRIVLTTFGSLGDLHPYIAVASGLKARGHHPVIATIGMYKEKIEALGIDFRPVRAVRVERPDGDLMKQAMDSKKGTEFIVRNLLMPTLRDAYDDTFAAADGADLIVTHPMTYATRLVAEKKGLRWVATMLAPMGFFSAYDPPVLPLPFLARLRFLGPAFHKPLLRFLKWTVRSWGEPWHRLRGDLGLPPAADPMFEGMVSPDLCLGMFSELLGAKQPDWPAHAEITGFPFYDKHGDSGMDPQLMSFLDSGPPPVVFTLGTSAVMDPGRFYEDSVEAVKKLGKRAVLLTGSDPRTRPSSLPEGVIAVDYAPFSELFPRAAAIVHQGGVGTTGQAMRGGRPMLVVPFAHDQPDNAERVRRLGISRTIPRHRYTANRAASELARLLGEEQYSAKASEVGQLVQKEDGVARACEVLERFASDTKAGIVMA